MADKKDELNDYAPAAVGAAAHYVGEQNAQKSDQAAWDLLAGQLGEYDNVKPQNYQVTERTHDLGPAAGAGVYADGESQNLQREALQSMMERARSGGFNAEDRARMSDTLQRSQAEAAAQRASIQSNAQQRGVAGSGLEYANAMGAAQGSANRLNQAQMTNAASANREALEAMRSGGQMAGQYRSQGVSEGQARAAAADRFAQLNQQNSQGVENRNTDRTVQGRRMAHQDEMELLRDRHGVMNQEYANLQGKAANSRNEAGYWGNLASQGMSGAGGPKGIADKIGNAFGGDGSPSSGSGGGNDYGTPAGNTNGGDYAGGYATPASYEGQQGTSDTSGASAGDYGGGAFPPDDENGGRYS